MGQALYLVVMLSFFNASFKRFITPGSIYSA